MVVEKVSEITPEMLADWVKLPDPTQEDYDFLATIFNAAKDYCQSYTGVTDLDSHPAFVWAVMVFCVGAWDERSITVAKGETNRVLESILGMYSVNLLSGGL